MNQFDEIFKKRLRKNISISLSHEQRKFVLQESKKHDLSVSGFMARLLELYKQFRTEQDQNTLPDEFK